MIGRFVVALATLAVSPGIISESRAQDVPGIEICTAEKTMERRTSCLQSNVEFLQKTISKLTTEHQQKLDAANRQIDGLKANIAALQKIVGDLQAAQNAPDGANKVVPPAKESLARDSKDGTGKGGTGKDAAAKEGAKESGK